ncbi:hypothetical protein [Lutibacter sp.]
MKNLYKIAAILALFIGAMSVFAGSKVLFGIDIKEYPVLNWLVLYNVIFGVISIIAAYLLWKKSLFSKRIIIFILVSHICMALYLYFFSETVAPESIKAMGFRISIWAIISLLYLNQNFKLNT